MTRRLKKVSPTDETNLRVSIMLPARDVRMIDHEANELTQDDPLGRTVTRSDVVRKAIHEMLGPKKRSPTKGSAT